jgi:L-threonylcarbamoyladenylate synthase
MTGQADSPRIVAVDGRAPAIEAVDEAVRALRGGLVIFPTDTLYALGARALDAALVSRVREAKGRPEDKPLPLVAASLAQARTLCAEWPLAADRLAQRFWPGPLTLILPAAAAVPEEVTSGSGTVAVRVPALEIARALCAGAGVLVSTSANRSGETAPLTCAEACARVGSFAALALDGGPGRPLASTIVSLVSGGLPALVREGPVAWAEVLAVLR